MLERPRPAAAVDSKDSKDSKDKQQQQQVEDDDDWDIPQQEFTAFAFLKPFRDFMVVAQGDLLELALLVTTYRLQ